MYNFTLQIYGEDAWKDAMTLPFDASKGFFRPCWGLQ